MRKKNYPESMIEREMRHSGGQVRIVPVPAAMRPTGSSLQNLEKEIRAQTDENEAVRTKSTLLSDRNYSGISEDAAGQRKKTVVNIEIAKVSKHMPDFDFEEEFEEI